MKPHRLPMDKHRRRILRFGFGLVATLGGGSCRAEASRSAPTPTPTHSVAIELPTPQETGSIPLEQAVARRRSVRTFTPQRLTQMQLSQLLWAAQGITDPRGFRAAPSAGALYPLELYVVSAEGFFHFQATTHQLEQLSEDDLRPAIWKAGLEQGALRDAPVVFLFTAVFQRTAKKYDGRAERYVYIEVGHAAQNLLLQAVALGLGGVSIGAFYDDQVQAELSLPADHAPMYLIPVGYPAN